ncbi:uncharacterized protein LOC122043541 [Zingiber officinale]|uniref:uncharacterized protein LOC122043541 n=1 Tax=Zingiber officinale TaxID=94328 RepID=UPI001C4A8B82|nr:uncharacterized protein LOC122043541 [Zingiber officinale]
MAATLASLPTQFDSSPTRSLIHSPLAASSIAHASSLRSPLPGDGDEEDDGDEESHFLVSLVCFGDILFSSPILASLLSIQALLSPFLNTRGNVEVCLMESWKLSKRRR